MTFNEWEKENWMYIDVKENARIIWDAAQSEERDACAKICDVLLAGVFDRDCDKYKYECAVAIRARSNAE